MSDGANDQKYDVCVIGGAGHVGAPLAIVFANKGVRTLVYDVNERALGELRAGRMPHLENGAEPELARALKGGALAFTSDASCVANAGILVVTIGTPIDEFHNPRLDVVTKCVDHYLRQHGKNLPVAFCPERVVQGNAIEELQTLPQIVSGTTTKAEKMAAALFG